jgi:hypothetical protein
MAPAAVRAFSLGTLWNPPSPASEHSCLFLRDTSIDDLWRDPFDNTNVRREMRAISVQ